MSYVSEWRKAQVRWEARQSEKRFAEIDKRFAEIKDKLNRSYNELKEIRYAQLLHDGSKGSGWFQNQTLDLHNWAANYSFIYLLFRILDKVGPQNILELGLGQTTKVTTQYIVNKNPGAFLNVCEHSKEWIDIYQGELLKHEHIRINQLELEYFEYKGKKNDKYGQMEKVAEGEKFDFVIVDGPVGGGKSLPRSNIIDLIREGRLREDFIIVFDDAERAGEQETIRKTKEALEEEGVLYETFERFGIKRQAYIVSRSRFFASYL